MRDRKKLHKSISLRTNSNFLPPYPERPGERGDGVLAGGVGGHGVHVAHAGEARSARQTVVKGSI